MKKLFFAAVVACVGFFSTSCDKDENGAPIVASMSATIDNKEWVAPLPTGLFSNDLLVITGTSLNGETVIIKVNGKDVGTYDLIPLLKSQCGATYKATLTATTEDAFISATGKVTISKFDSVKKRVSGTFEFTLANASLTTMQISKGTFNDVSYVVK